MKGLFIRDLYNYQKNAIFLFFITLIVLPFILPHYTHINLVIVFFMLWTLCFTIIPNSAIISDRNNKFDTLIKIMPIKKYEWIKEKYIEILLSSIVSIMLFDILVIILKKMNIKDTLFYSMIVLSVMLLLYSFRLPCSFFLSKEKESIISTIIFFIPMSISFGKKYLFPEVKFKVTSEFTPFAYIYYTVYSIILFL